MNTVTFIGEKRAEKEMAKALEMQEKAKLKQLENEKIAKQNELNMQELNNDKAKVERKQLLFDEYCSQIL